MRPLLFLFLCVSAYSAPLPPFPGVNRPALLSPKAAAVPKAKPMLRTTVKTSGYVLPPVFVSYEWCVNYDQCDTNDVNCLMHDFTYVSTVQPAGVAITLEFTGIIPSGGDFIQAATFGPAAEDQEVFVGLNEFSKLRPPMRIWRSAQAFGPTTGFAPAGSIRVNPALKGITAWRRPKK